MKVSVQPLNPVSGINQRSDSVIKSQVCKTITVARVNLQGLEGAERYWLEPLSYLKRPYQLGERIPVLNADGRVHCAATFPDHHTLALNFQYVIILLGFAYLHDRFDTRQFSEFVQGVNAEGERMVGGIWPAASSLTR